MLEALLEALCWVPRGLHQRRLLVVSWLVGWLEIKRRWRELGHYIRRRLGQRRLKLWPQSRLEKRLLKERVLRIWLLELRLFKMRLLELGLLKLRLLELGLRLQRSPGLPVELVLLGMGNACRLHQACLETLCLWLHAGNGC